MKRGNINGSLGLFHKQIWDPFIQKSHHLSWCPGPLGSICFLAISVFTLEPHCGREWKHEVRVHLHHLPSDELSALENPSSASFYLLFGSQSKPKFDKWGTL